MNILFLNWRDPNNPRAGGAEYVSMKHAAAWVVAGHTVTWFSSTFSGGKSEEVINGVTIVRKGGGIGLFLRAFYFYKTSVTKYDLVIDQIHGIPFFTPLYVSDPIVAFIHEVAGEIWDYSYPFPVNKIGRTLERLSFSFYKKIQFWTDANSTIDELVEMGIRRSNCVAIACPIEIAPLRKLPRKENSPTFLFIGRLVPMKGAGDAIESFAAIRRDFPHAKLWIAGLGDQKYLQELQDKVKKLQLDEWVHFYGYVTQEKKIELMRSAHLLLHPSVKEGWGLVVLEAASQATPTVGYNVSGLRDTIIDGVTGSLVKKQSPSAMANAAKSLLKDSKSYISMQRECLTFSTKFSWADAEKKSLEMIAAVVRKSPVTAI